MGEIGTTNTAPATNGGGDAQPMVFISYRHSALGDRLAEEFRRRLVQAGCSIYIDKENGWGSRWVDDVRLALERAHFVLLLLSREAARSEFVWAEVELARQISEERDGRPTILPVRVQLPPNERLPYHLTARLYGLHYREWARDEDTEALATELIGLLRRRQHALAEAAVSHVRTAEAVDPTAIEQGPGGAIDIASPVYVRRDADTVIKRQIGIRRSLTTVKAPRQMGKTSMVFRAIAEARGQNGPRAAFVDFQALQRAELADSDSLWRAIARRIAVQLKIAEWQPQSWDARTGHEHNLGELLSRHAFAADKRDLLICFDEADRLFGTPIRDEFFGSVRALFNLGAMDALWAKVRWLLVTSTEPSFFIADVKQSPFNVGRQVDLPYFFEDDIVALAATLGLFVDTAIAKRIHAYLGGHPYLTHRALHDAATANPAGGPKAIEAALRPEQFRDHLHRFLIQLKADRGLGAALHEILLGRACSDPFSLERLRAAGLVRQEGSRHTPAAGLYADFFARELGG